MTRFRKYLPAPAAVLLILCLAACGGGSDEDDVRSASEDFVAAFKDENWNDVCSLMTEDSKKQLEQAGELLDAEGGCADVWEKAAEFVPAEAKQQLEDFEIERVEVDGDTAAVTAANAKGGPTQLRREGGEWRVNFEQ